MPYLFDICQGSKFGLLNALFVILKGRHIDEIGWRESELR